MSLGSRGSTESVDSVIRTNDSSLLRQQLVIKELENRFLRHQITAQQQEIEQLEAASSSTKTQTHHPVSRVVRLNHLAETIKAGMKTRKMKTTLAATLTPPATLHQDGVKVTKEQLDRHQNPKRRFGLIRDTVQTVSKSSRTLRTTSHKLLSMSRFLFQPPS